MSELKKKQSSLTYDELYEIASQAVVEKHRKGIELSDIELDLLFEQVSGEDAVNLANAIAGIPIKDKK